MENKKIILFLVFFILNLHLVIFVSAQNIKIDNNVNKLFDSIKNQQDLQIDNFDSEIKDVYNTSENFYNRNVKDDRVYVTITLKDNSGIVFNGTKEERHKQTLLQDEWYKEEVDKIIDSLNEKDFTLQRKDSVSFSGLVSKEGFEKLKQNSGIEAIELNYLGKSTLFESARAISVDQVWSKYNGSGIKVCVIDSGLMDNRANVFNHIENESCYCNHSPIPGGCCENGDVTDTSARDDDATHGTIDTGIVASNINSSGDRGIAPESNLYIIKIMDTDILGTDWYTNNDLASAIHRCVVDWDVNVITFSGGGYDSDCSVSNVNAVINQAENNNIIFVASSGNGGYVDKILYPACYGSVVSVGATYDDNFGREPDSGNYNGANCYNSNAGKNNLVCFTDRDSNLDLLAPGYMINFTVPGRGTISMAGTSQAAPHVAGAAALLLQKDPALTPSEIQYIFQSTGVDVFDNVNSRNNGPSSNLNFKMINVSAAINSISTCECDSWSQVGGCGYSPCDTDEKYYTRTCTDNCDSETKCEYDSNCETGTPAGVQSCTPDSCSLGYDDYGVINYSNGNYWTSRRGCFQQTLSDWIHYDSDAATGAGWKSDGTVYCDSMSVSAPANYNELKVETDIGYSSSSGELNQLT